jgi:hypothetical protein
MTETFHQLIGGPLHGLYFKSPCPQVEYTCVPLTDNSTTMYQRKTLPHGEVVYHYAGTEDIDTPMGGVGPLSVSY